MNSYHEKLVSLSIRERQILEHLLDGMGVSQIAKVLNLKNNTISTVKKNILYKFNVKTLVKLIYLLEVNGIKIKEIDGSDTIKLNNQNEDKLSQLISVRNSNSFFELVKIGTKDFVFEINKEGVKSIYKKIK